MELLSMKCPNCAGEINYKHGKTSCKCPYCDSVIKISMSAEDLDYEQMMRDNAAAEEAKKTYLAKLKNWQTIKYISMALCLVIGFVFGFAPEHSSVQTIVGFPVIVLLFGGGPILHSFAPTPPDIILNKITPKERPNSTGALYGIVIGMVLLGGVFGEMAKGDGSSENDSASSVASVVYEMDQGR